MSNTSTPTTTTPIRTLLIEDYKLVRIGLASVLNGDESISVVGQAETAEEGLEILKNNPTDVILLDIGLPGMSGIEALPQIKELSPKSRVVMLTLHDSRDEVISALRAGANAYCLKDIPSNRLLEVIKSVHEGAAWLDPGIAAVAMELFQHADALTPKTNEAMKSLLTPREYEVLKLLVEGNSNSEIAGQIHVSVHTVKVQVSSILEKLAVSDRVQAAVKAVKEGIV